MMALSSRLVPSSSATVIKGHDRPRLLCAGEVKQVFPLPTPRQRLERALEPRRVHLGPPPWITGATHTQLLHLTTYSFNLS